MKSSQIGEKGTKKERERTDAGNSLSFKRETLFNYFFCMDSIDIIERNSQPFFILRAAVGGARTVLRSKNDSEKRRD